MAQATLLRLVLRLGRLAHRAAQGEVAGREGVLRLLLLQGDAQVLVRLVVAAEPGQRQAVAAQQRQRRRACPAAAWRTGRPPPGSCPGGSGPGPGRAAPAAG